MDTNKNERNCDQRIDQQLQRRLEELFPDVNAWGVLKCARLLKSEGRPIKSANVEELREEVSDVIREGACQNLLSVDKIITYSLCLSWGGPADFFELDWAENSREWKGGRYVFQDWFDGASRPITAEQTGELADLFGIYPGAG